MIKTKLVFVFLSLCLLFNCIIKVDAQTKRRRTPRVPAPAAAITTPSGLTYLITKKGMGQQPKKGETVIVHYTGMLTNGVKFDSSRDRNEPFEFKLGTGQVIKGWDEGFSNLRVGDHAILVIPSNLAYGARGAGGVIPPDSKLIFLVELVDIRSESRVSPQKSESIVESAQVQRALASWRTYDCEEKHTQIGSWH